MASNTYLELLRDPRWQKKRLEVLNESNWQCSLCFSKGKTLHVHHLQYRKGAMPWEYSREELEVLCEDCHDLAHLARRRLRSMSTSCRAGDAIFTLIALYRGGAYSREEIDELHATLASAELKSA